MNNTDVYSQLWHRLLPLYDKEEAVAIARLVLDTLFQLSLTDIVMGRADELSVADRQRLNDVADQLVKGMPVQYALHECVFCDHVFHVAPGVLIPRPETEELCRKVIADNATLPCPHMLDIGTGSGCIAITLALALPKANVEAIDLSKEALAIASDNALRLGAKVTFAERDALRLTAAPQPLWDAIVSNPPYVTEKERATQCAGLRTGTGALCARRRPAALLPGHRALCHDGLAQRWTALLRNQPALCR